MKAKKLAWIGVGLLLLVLVSQAAAQPAGGVPGPDSVNDTESIHSDVQTNGESLDDCSSCHSIKGSYKSVFWDNCDQCHTPGSDLGGTRSFVAHPEHADSSLNPSNMTTVPDEHRSFSEPGMLECQRCHGSTAVRCESCHQDYHDTREACTSCHNSMDELPTHSVAPMGGAHQGFQCTKCHDGDNGYLADIYGDKIPFNRAHETCSGCHRSTTSKWKEGEHYAPEFQPTEGILDSNMTREEWAQEYTCTSCHNPHSPVASSAPQTVEGDDGNQLLVRVVKRFLHVESQIQSFIDDIAFPVLLMLSGLMFIVLGGVQMVISHMRDR